MEHNRALGRRHPLVRRLRALRADRARRDAEGVLLAEGLHLADEALAAGAAIELAVVSPRLAAVPGGSALERRLRDAGVPVERTGEEMLRTLQDARSPQPILLLVRREPTAWEAVWDARRGPPLIVWACGVQDPGNLGSLLRSADAAGATALLASEGTADLFHPRTVRATMGSIFRLPALRADADEVLQRLAQRGVTRIAAVPGRGEPYDAVDLRGPCALCLGGEGAGLPASLVERMDRLVHVPLRPEVESLSVGAAGAVLLFEAARQRRGAGVSTAPEARQRDR